MSEELQLENRPSRGIDLDAILVRNQDGARDLESCLGRGKQVFLRIHSTELGALDQGVEYRGDHGQGVRRMAVMWPA